LNLFFNLKLFTGILWTTGNLVTVFCIKTCGLAVGLLIWGTTSLIMGWAGGRFGIFGVTAQVPSTTSKLALNYASVVLAAVSAIFFLFIKSTPTPRQTPYVATYNEEASVELSKLGNINTENEDVLETDFPFLNRFSENVQKILGCALAGLAGVFYGLMFIPDQYIRDHKEKYMHHNEFPSDNGLYYIHSQYSGILLSSLFYFIVYAALKRNKPAINASVALPAMVSGTMWGIANIGFIVAISALTSAVAYPIVSVLPGIVTSLWSLFLFREIQGRNNYIFLGCGMAIRILAAVLSGLSA
jgi:glucose uptake protein GlcU